jgi:tetratricopeptide (TPR) repeat protein
MGFQVVLSAFILVAAGCSPAAAADGWTETWERSMAGAAAAWPAGSDPTAARKHYQTALEEVMKHGPGTLRHARTLDELAFLNLMEGGAEQAESLYLESIPMLEKLLGPDQPRIATSLHNLGVLYLRAGRDDKAEPPIREALRIWVATLGPRHPDTARARRSLSVLMRRRGQDQEADRLEELAAPFLTAPTNEPER